MISVGYLLARGLLGCLMVLIRRELSKDAELPVPRHENAVLRRQVSQVRHQPADRLWLVALSQMSRELFDQLLIVNEHHLRRVLTGYLLHYNTARPHSALGQLTPAEAPTRPRQTNLAEHRIRRKQTLGALTSEYQIAA